MEPLVTRPMTADEVGLLVAMVGETGVFRDDELAVAREVLESCAARGEASGYRCWVAEAAGAPAGFACYGPTPCTEGTFDLYWIVVRPGSQGRGLARALLERAVQGARDSGGRLLVAETSDTEPYGPARAFYEGTGFNAAARIPDFYRPGDAKIVYVMTLSTPTKRGEQ